MRNIESHRLLWNIPYDTYVFWIIWFLWFWIHCFLLICRILLLTMFEGCGWKQSVRVLKGFVKKCTFLYSFISGIVESWIFRLVHWGSEMNHDFFEIKMFSVIRSCLQVIILLLDSICCNKYWCSRWKQKMIEISMISDFVVPTNNSWFSNDYPSLS